MEKNVKRCRLVVLQIAQSFNQYNLLPDLAPNSHATFVSRLVLEMRALGLFDQRKVTRSAGIKTLFQLGKRFDSLWSRLYEMIRPSEFEFNS